MADTFTPAWDLTINDDAARLTERHRAAVRRLRVIASVDGADELEIEAEMIDQLDREYRFVGETILAPGNTVIVWAGYEGAELTALQRFELVDEGADYGPGKAVVKIRGLSAEHRLVDYTKARKFTGPISDSDIVTQIAEEHGLVANEDSVAVTDSRDAGRLKKEGDTDWEFIVKLARANGLSSPFVRYNHDLKSDVLYWRTVDLSKQEEVATFVYYPPLAEVGEAPATCFEFFPRASLAGIPTAVRVTGWDPWTQEPIQVTAEIGADGQKTTVQSGKEVGTYDPAVKSGGQLVVAVLDTSKAADKTEKIEAFFNIAITTSEDALAWTSRWLDTRSRAFMTARGKVKGWQWLWIGQVHYWDGLAGPHNGPWETTEVVHDLVPGPYVCEVELDRVLEEAAAPTEGG